MSAICRIISISHPDDEDARYYVQKRFLWFFWRTLIVSCEHDDGPEHDEGPVHFDCIANAQHAARERWGNVYFYEPKFLVEKIECGGFFTSTR